jgi:hypothetical protein
MESVFQESPPPQLSCSGPLRLTLSLSLIKEGFSLRNLRKSSKPITVVRDTTWEIRAGWGLILDCQWYMGRAKLQCTKTFFLQLSALSLLKLSFSRFDLLRRKSKNSQLKEEFLFKL